MRKRFRDYKEGVCAYTEVFTLIVQYVHLSTASVNVVSSLTNKHNFCQIVISKFILLCLIVNTLTTTVDNVLFAGHCTKLLFPDKILLSTALTTHNPGYCSVTIVMY
jgi:hypothetical protein